MKIEALKSTRKRNAKIRAKANRYPGGFIYDSPELREALRYALKLGQATRVKTKPSGLSYVLARGHEAIDRLRA